ncbi:MAG: hypothetical protein VR65_00140 [Desulfobulbaceae bacterium BRH_c16a]|nr:MAG: hypothetical protein VR65_00140 [Desulfobulbaceae bacterium BRH_c16a]
MKTLRELLDHPEFMVILFLFCTALFGWPFISIAGLSSPESMFIYLFFVWGAVIVLLFFISRSHDSTPSDKDRGSEN